VKRSPFVALVLHSHVLDLQKIRIFCAADWMLKAARAQLRYFLSFILPFGVSILFLSTVLAHAASFDCTKAATNLEIKICADPELSSLDSKLSVVYREALAAVAPSSRQALVNEQRNWIRYSRALCENVTCLQAAYTSRISTLMQDDREMINQASCETPSGSATCQTVILDRDPNARIISFNETLTQQKNPGRIIGCTQLLELPVGYANSNDSYGGYCVIENGAARTQVEICNDDMFGHFAMQSIEARDESEKSLVDFTFGQCFGG
jgi:uncharacterized protein